MARHYNFGRQPALAKSLQAGVSGVPVDRRKAWRERQQEKFTRWARIQDSPTSALVCLTRVETLEVGAGKEVLRIDDSETGTKGVLFKVAPQAELFNGTKLYVNPRFQTELVFCGWDDFLRLTRWHKGREHLPSEQQADLALVAEMPTTLHFPDGSQRLFMWRVWAVRPQQTTLFEG